MIAQNPDSSSSPTSSSDSSQDADSQRLALALEAVKEDIISNSKTITSEKSWVSSVNSIITSYQQKVSRVQAHVTSIRKEQKKLFDTKKQIENLQLQKQLQTQLTSASDEMQTLKNSLTVVQQKSQQLTSEQSTLQSAISQINSQLTKLKGQASSPTASTPTLLELASLQREIDKLDTHLSHLATSTDNDSAL